MRIGAIIQAMNYKKIWQGSFGKEYTKRNTHSVDETDNLYRKDFGISRTQLNKEFLIKKIKKKSRILEVGCNIGNQLLFLQKMGFSDLWGIELQDYACKIAKKRIKGANIVRASADNIPFKDNYFDLVFSSGLLIHIPPKNIKKVLDEIYRCSALYIWGFEYYLKRGYEMIKYRGEKDLLWKTNFPQLFLAKFSDLKIVKKKVLKYKKIDNRDIMYLLKKEERV